jgi:hypothetical protein
MPLHADHRANPQVLLPLLIAIGLTSCGQNPQTLVEDSPDVAACQAGCVGPGTDPNPSSPGEWLGPDFTDDLCFGGSGDEDTDGMVDLCEYRLAEAFAPRFISAPAADDDLGGEWYWAVRPGSSSGAAVILYMPAYYRDLGDPPLGITAHEGDSEVLVFGVQYQASSSHWLLKTAGLSHHGDMGHHFPGPSGYPASLSYPVRSGGHPNIWLAKWKHANYASASECQGGGAGSADSCYPPWETWRFPVYEHHNVGSAWSRFKDCVQAEFNPTRTGTECLWQIDYLNSTFRGWHGSANSGGEPYGNALVEFGFFAQ